MSFELAVKEAQEYCKKSAMDNPSLSLEEQNADRNAKIEARLIKFLKKDTLSVLEFLIY